MGRVRQVTKLRAGSATVLGAGTVAKPGQSNQAPNAYDPGTFTFTEGVAATRNFPAASDPDGDTVTIVARKTIALNTGVSIDLEEGTISSDGSGTAGTTSGHVVYLDDGKDDDVGTIELTSALGGSLLAYSWADVFAEGEVPAGWDVFLDVPDFQSNIITTWPDGSARHVKFACRADFEADTPKTLRYIRGKFHGLPALTEDDLAALDPDIVMDYDEEGSVDLADLIGLTSNGYDEPGLFRTWFAGPEYALFEYHTLVGDNAHLSARIYVELYRGMIGQVGCAIDNGWLKVESPGSKSYTLTISMNGTQRFQQAITHKHHTGWIHFGWYGTDPQITPKHDGARIMATKMVPPYLYGAPTNDDPYDGSVFGHAALIDDNDTPFQLGNWRPDSMGSGGYHPSIGPIMDWAVLYLTGGDKRAWDAMICNDIAYGRYPIRYRDETTGKPFKRTDDLGLGIAQVNDGFDAQTGPGSGLTQTPAPTDGGFATNETWEVAHHPNAGFLSWLLTGHPWFLELVQFNASTSLLSQSVSSRNPSNSPHGVYANGQIRGVAWTLRAQACAALCTPKADSTVVSPADADDLKGEYLYIVGRNATDRWALWGDPENPEYNELGVIALSVGFPGGQDPDIPGDGVNVDAYWHDKPWQMFFLSGMLGWISEMQLELSSGELADLIAMRDHSYKLVKHMLGGNSVDEWCYTRIGKSVVAFGTPEQKPPTDWFTNGGEMWTATFGSPNTACTAGSDLVDNGPGTQNWAQSVSANAMFAIAYGVDHRPDLCLAGFQRLEAAGNWPSCWPFFKRNPVWGFRPRTVGAPPT